METLRAMIIIIDKTPNDLKILTLHIILLRMTFFLIQLKIRQKNNHEQKSFRFYSLYLAL